MTDDNACSQYFQNDLNKVIYLLHNSIICEGGPECSYLFNDRRLCFFHDKIRK